MKMEVKNSIQMKRIFKFVFITLFVDLLAFTLILPLLPKILDYYANHDESNAFKLYNENVKMVQNLLGIPESHNKVLLAGMLGSWFSFLQFVSSPFLGALSDRFGRKGVMLMTMSGSVLSYSIWLISSNNFSLFILSRTIGGLSKANVGLSLAIISDVSDESSRGQGMAVVGSSFSLAFIFGPLLGAYLSTLAEGKDNLNAQLVIYPALIALFLSLVSILLVVVLLDETNPIPRTGIKEERKQQRRAQEVSEQNTLIRSFHFVNPRSLFEFTLVKHMSPTQKNYLKTTGIVYFYYLLFYSGLEFTLSFLTHLRFQFSSMDQGKLYLYSGLLMALIQGGYIRRIKGGREATIALIGLTMIIPAFIFMGLSSKVSHIYFSLTMYAISSAIVVPCLTAIVSSNCPVENRGAVMGTFRSIGALARAIGPFFASFLFWTLGPTICYISGAFALIIPHHLMRNIKWNMENGKKSTETGKAQRTSLPHKLAKAN